MTADDWVVPIILCAFGGIGVGFSFALFGIGVVEDTQNPFTFETRFAMLLLPVSVIVCGLGLVFLHHYLRQPANEKELEP